MGQTRWQRLIGDGQYCTFGPPPGYVAKPTRLELERALLSEAKLARLGNPFVRTEKDAEAIEEERREQCESSS